MDIPLPHDPFSNPYDTNNQQPTANEMPFEGLPDQTIGEDFTIDFAELEPVAPEELRAFDHDLEEKMLAIAVGSEYEQKELYGMGLGKPIGQGILTEGGDLHVEYIVTKNEDGSDFTHTTRIKYNLPREQFGYVTIGLEDVDGKVRRVTDTHTGEEAYNIVPGLGFVQEILDGFGTDVEGDSLAVVELMSVLLGAYRSSEALTHDNVMLGLTSARRNVSEVVTSDFIHLSRDLKDGQSFTYGKSNLGIQGLDSQGGRHIKERHGDHAFLRVIKPNPDQQADMKNVAVLDYERLGDGYTVKFEQGDRVPAEPSSNQPEEITAEDGALTVSVWMAPKYMAEYIQEEKERRAGVYNFTRAKLQKCKDIINQLGIVDV